MLESKRQFMEVFSRIRFLYIFVYILFIVLKKFIVLQYLPSQVDSVIYAAFAGGGLVLLLIDFLVKRLMFTVKHSGVMALFMGAIMLSIIVNLRYGIVDNVKTFIWMGIQIFLLCAVDSSKTREQLWKEFRIITETFCFIWFIGVLISFGQYIIQYQGVVDIINKMEGFAGGRLYGVFTDPNLASLCSLFAIIFTLINWTSKRTRKITKTYYVLTIIFQFFYIILAGSRTMQIVFLMMIFAGAVLFMGILFAQKKMHKVATALSTGLVSVFCVIVAAGGMMVVKNGLAYVPALSSPLVLALEEKFLPNISPEEKEIEKEKTQQKIDMIRPDVEGNADISNARFKIWGDYLDVFKTTPIAGTSPRNALAIAEERFDEMYIIDREYTVHNGYLAVLVFTGIIGASICVIWGVLVLKTILGYLIRRSTSRDEYYVPIALLTVALAATAVSAIPLFLIFFANSSIELLFWWALGYVFCFIRKSEPELYQKEPFLYRLCEKVQNKFIKQK